MNNKKKSFIIFNIFLLIFVIAINNFVLYYFKDLSYLFFLNVPIFVIFYFVLSKSLVDDIFQIDSKLKYKIEKTMHELNTPISTIEMNSAILETKIKDESNLKRLERINLACKNLLKLYQDMEYSIKKEIDRVEIVSFDLRKSILHSVDKFKDIKCDTKINLELNPLIVKCDKSGFEIVIDNFISNALKHNKDLKNLNIKLQDNLLIINDDGAGIKSEEIYKIFDKFFQSDSSIEGFGFGLNIIKDYCDKYKIDIKIDTSISGTTFYLNLVNVIDKI